ncbi:MAG: hypothetical protein IJN29_06440 [Akkermansia sp.]|nr:hypothetical protein [Akkermansia sp.]
MKQQLRSFLMVLSFLVGGLLHESIHAYGELLPLGITAMLTITFLGLDTSQLRPRLMHVWVLLALQLVWITAWFSAHLLGYPVLAESVYYCGAAPIASAAPIIVHLLRGNVGFITTAMVLSQILFALLTPFVLPFVVNTPDLSYTELMLLVAKQIGIVLGIPAVAACTLRLLYPPCKTWAGKLKDVSLGIWNFNLIIVSAIGTHRILGMDYTLWDMLPMALGAIAVCAVGFLAGYRLGYPSLKRECSQALGQKNTILTLYIAGQPYATPLAYIGPVFYVFCHNMANAIQLALAAREQKRLSTKSEGK